MCYITSAADAVSKIPEGANIILTGFVNHSVPVATIQALSQSRNEHMTLICTTGLVAMNQIDPSRLDRCIFGHWGLVPNLAQAVKDGRIEGYNLPQGVMTEIIRKNGLVKTDVGKGTFVEHRRGCLFDTESNGFVVPQEDKLGYCLPFMEVAIIKAKAMDLHGNIQLCDLPTDAQNAAIAVRHNGGLVIAEVDEIVHSGRVRNDLGSRFINMVVIGNNPEPKLERNDSDVPEHIKAYVKRAAQLVTDDVKLVNLGIGLPEAIAPYLPEQVTQTVEAGIIGGKPLGGALFGRVTGEPDEVMSHNEMFRRYKEGILDMTFLGVGRFDMQGNVNVHNFGGRVAGCGGFIDITESAKVVVFCAKNNKLHEDVGEITFNGPLNAAKGKRVFYLTEDKLYKLTETGLVEV